MKSKNKKYIYVRIGEIIPINAEYLCVDGKTWLPYYPDCYKEKIYLKKVGLNINYFNNINGFKNLRYIG